LYKESQCSFIPDILLSTLSGAQATQCKMVGCSEHNELRIMWKEAAAADSRYYPKIWRGAEEKPVMMAILQADICGGQSGARAGFL
jgi:hypothetical protein